jgi:hypothetical protein
MDDPADVSSQNRPGQNVVDGCVSTRNRKVVGSNPTSGSISAGKQLSSKPSTFGVDQAVAT